MLEFTGILHLDTEKIVDCGEDSMTYKFDESGNGYMFVFDGSGGAGSERHFSLDNRKSAYIASRACALFLDKYIETNRLDTPQTVETFTQQLHTYLKNINDSFPMEIAESSLVDVLPTTISGIVISNNESALYANYIWAGDSRGYIIDSNGLSQVTEDDVNSEDAFTNITDDAIMNNRIHGNKNKKSFVIHSSRLELKEKCVLICATDGCYDYFNSPMVFEYLILSAIRASSNFSDVEKQLNQVLHEQSGDDCSLIMACFGFQNYDEVKQYLYERYRFLDKEKEYFDKAYWNDKFKNHYYRYNSRRSVKND